jgi:glutamyl-tRNA reductase
MIVGDTSVPIAAFVLVAPAADTATRMTVAADAPARAASLGGVALVTCHRVELYVPRAESGDRADEPAWPGARRVEGAAAAEHAISVAVGLESAVVGEDQVLHQLRSSVATARRRGLAEPVDLLFEHALRAGRTGRSWRPVRARSLADVAVARLASSLARGLAGGDVLVVGAGQMGRLAAIAAAKAGARVRVASPTAAHAETLAAAVGGTAVPFDPGSEALDVDGVIVALSGPWTCAPPSLDALHGVPLVVDLSMPRALPEGTIAAMGARYVDLDSLARTGTSVDPARDRASTRYRERLESLRAQTLRSFIEALAAREAGDLAGSLARRVDAQRRAELEVLWRRLPDVEPDERAAIEAMTRHLAGRLFRAPLRRLAAERDGRRQQLARELFEL